MSKVSSGGLKGYDLTKLQKTQTPTLGSSASVGIGTTSADSSYKLHVKGNTRIEGDLIVNGTQTVVNTGVTTTERLDITNDGTGPALKITQTGAQPVAQFFDDSNLAFIVADGGNVGIGIAAPTYKLDVVGDINFTGNIYKNGTLFSSGGGGGSITSQTTITTDSNPQLTLSASGYHIPAVLRLMPTGFTYPNTGIRQSFVDFYGRWWQGQATPFRAASIYIEREASHGYGGSSLVFASEEQYTSTGFPSERMRIRNNGNVGIGTTNPSHKLHVVGDINLTGSLYQNGSLFSGGSSQWTSNGSKIYYNTGNVGIGKTDPNHKLVVKANSTSDDVSVAIIAGEEMRQAILFLGTPGGGNDSCKSAIIAEGIADWSKCKMHFCLNNQGWDNVVSASLSDARMTLTPWGYVGIGTTTPGNMMDIVGAARTESHATGRPLYVTGDINASDNGIEFRHSNGSQGIGFGYNTIYAAGYNTDQHLNLMPKGTNGFVGIGTNEPSYKLHVIGDINFTGNLYKNGSLFSSGGGGSSTQELVLYNYSYQPAYWDHMRLWHDGGSAYIDAGGAENGINFRVASGNQNYPAENYNQVMTLNANGRVGIGTVAPSAPLHISTPSASAGSIDAILSQGVVDPDFWLVAQKGDNANTDGTIYFRYGLIYSPTSRNNAMIRFHRGPGETGGFLSFSTSWDNERMRIDASGNVGIGTTAPSEKLDVNGNINCRGVFSMDNSNWMKAKNASGSYENFLWPRWNDNSTYLNYGSGGFYIRNNSSTTTMFMTNDGKVGIGTGSPTSQLEVYEGIITLGNNSTASSRKSVRYIRAFDLGSTSAIAQIGFVGTGTNGYNGAIVFETKGNGDVFNDSTTEKMRIDSAGNVGIGTTSPSATLDVAGSVVASGTSGFILKRPDGVITANKIFAPTGDEFRFQSGSGSGIFTFHTNNGSVTEKLRMNADGSLTHNSLPASFCRTWIRFRGSDGAIFGHNNVSSVTRWSGGYYTVNFTSAMPDTNYAAIAGFTQTTDASYNDRFISIYDIQTTGCSMVFDAWNIAPIDASSVSVAIFR